MSLPNNEASKSIKKITITDEDLTFGIRRGRHSCPIARAMIRETGQFVQVDERSMVIESKVFSLGQSLIDWISNYDENGIKEGLKGIEIDYEKMVINKV